MTDPRRILPFVALLILLLLPAAAQQPGGQTKEDGLRLAGEFLIPAGTRIEALGPERFGGISGLAPLPGGRELLGISDDDHARIYRLEVSETSEGLRVTPVEAVPLQRGAGAPPRLDPEGIALTHTGTVLVSMEGFGTAALPPAILEYARDGRFIRQLPVPPRFVPNAGGRRTRGVRRNGGFESLTITPDHTRLFTANEIPLVQDGPADAFAASRIRIVEYALENGGYRPSREFAYELAALARPPFETGSALNGLVELLAVSGTELLALERGFIQMRGARIGVTSVRLYRISLDGATDVSSIERLADARDVRPVRKTLVQDFGTLAGRSLRLINQENFEGLAWIGEGDARRLLVVSDDNFSAVQVTAFLLLENGNTRLFAK